MQVFLPQQTNKVVVRSGREGGSRSHAPRGNAGGSQQNLRILRLHIFQMYHEDRDRIYLNELLLAQSGMHSHAEHGNELEPTL